VEYLFPVITFDHNLFSDNKISDYLESHPDYNL